MIHVRFRTGVVRSTVVPSVLGEDKRWLKRFAFRLHGDSEQFVPSSCAKLIAKAISVAIIPRHASPKEPLVVVNTLLRDLSGPRSSVPRASLRTVSEWCRSGDGPGDLTPS